MSDTPQVSRNGPFENIDIWGKKGPTALLYRWFGLDSRRKQVHTALLVIVPSLVMALAAYSEGRFFLGSVTATIPGIGQVLGMSYLGDTMVWPFSFLVPACLLLTLAATIRTTNLLNSLCRNLDISFGTKVPSEDYAATIEQTKRVLSGKQGWLGRTLRVVPWVIAILFWSYNTTTCMFHDYLPETAYPYRSDKVVVIKATTGGMERQTVSLRQPVSLPKWDTDRKNAPLSTTLARVWALVFYSIAPFLLVRLIFVVWGMSYFVGRFRNWVRDLDVPGTDALMIKPFSSDGYGGMAHIAETGMAYFYAAMAFLMLVLMAFLKEGPDPSWHNYVLVSLLFPLAIVLFLIPALHVRKIVAHAKTRYLGYISDQMNLMFSDVSTSIQSKKLGQLDQNFHSALMSLNIFFKQVENMQEWPFLASTLFRMAGAIVVPVSLMVLDAVLSNSIGPAIPQ